MDRSDDDCGNDSTRDANNDFLERNKMDNDVHLNQHDLPTLLTVDETALLLRTSRKAIYAMAERAQLPGATRIGRRLLVRSRELLTWLDERSARSLSSAKR